MRTVTSWALFDYEDSSGWQWLAAFGFTFMAFVYMASWAARRSHERSV